MALKQNCAHLGNTNWLHAAGCLEESGNLIQSLVDKITELIIADDYEYLPEILQYFEEI